MKMKLLTPKFVEYIPEHKDDGIIYISMEYRIAIHKCVCGCGCEVITPLAPGEWQLYFDGETISLSPSIGNWRFECRSHYWIKNNMAIQINNYTESPKNKQKKQSLWKRLWSIFG